MDAFVDLDRVAVWKQGGSAHFHNIYNLTSSPPTIYTVGSGRSSARRAGLISFFAAEGTSTPSRAKTACVSGTPAAALPALNLFKHQSSR